MKPKTGKSKRIRDNIVTPVVLPSQHKRNTSGLLRGGPGRPKGSLDKATKEIKEFWTEFFASDEYKASALTRIVEGKAPHLENYWQMLINGRPTERVEHSGQVSMPTRVVFELHRRDPDPLLIGDGSLSST